MTEYKTCTYCKQTKPLTDYYIDSNTGREKSRCKKCINFLNNQARQANPEKHRKTNLEYYYKNKDALNEYRRAKWPEIYKQTKEHRSAQRKEHFKKHPDKVRAMAHRRRARKRANGWEKYTEAQVLELYGTNCHICGDPIDLDLPRKVGTEGWEMSLQLDHVIPISKGGPDKLSNVKPAHAKCNLKKRATLLENLSEQKQGQ